MASLLDVEHWTEATFPDYPFVYLGVSGAALLLDALREEGRKRLVLPAFICPTVSAMGLATGMELVHVDVETNTLHFKDDSLEEALTGRSPRETVLLVDHCFGYAYPHIAALKERHPDLLVIEDCVRALGAKVRAAAVGHEGDWVLFSMYKNTPGSDHGAILLTKRGYSIRTGRTPPIKLLQRVSTVPLFRRLYDVAKRYRFNESPASRNQHSPQWEPVFGTPNSLARRRFMKQVCGLANDQLNRRTAQEHIQRELQKNKSILVAQSAADCQCAGFFLTCMTPRRDALVTHLRQRGHFVVRAWNSVPAFYSCFEGTFPGGAEGSMFLADHVFHIPLWRYITERSRNQLVHDLDSVTRSVLAPAG